ncbi:hypothetical protein [Amycolatopsis tucumanensis]|uniref:hypothetical protein n=1 Tax=Amycolatopsis tucumanensis TaxID=401106 RepID=UPI003D7219B5
MSGNAEPGSLLSRFTPPRRRTFAPWYVTRLRSHFLLVDRFQPVAVSMSTNGRVVDVVSWASSAAAPEKLGWPNRRVVPGEDRLLVQDLPDGAGVVLEVTADGRLDHRIEPDVPEHLPGAIHRRLFAPVSRTVAAGDPGGHTWHIESMTDGFFRSAAVTLSGVGRFDLPRPASVSALAAMGDELAFVCVQRADKRPWNFEPETQLWMVQARNTLCAGKWSSRRTCRTRCQAFLQEFQAVNPELTIHGDVTAGDVTVDLTFGLPHLPDVRFRRRDHPFDEGRPLSGLIDALAPHAPGLTDV